jgi:hypothetical protein
MRRPSGPGRQGRGCAQRGRAAAPDHHDLTYPDGRVREVTYSRTVNRQWMRDQFTQYLDDLQTYISRDCPAVVADRQGTFGLRARPKSAEAKAVAAQLRNE